MIVTIITPYTVNSIVNVILSHVPIRRLQIVPNFQSTILITGYAISPKVFAPVMALVGNIVFAIVRPATILPL